MKQIKRFVLVLVGVVLACGLWAAPRLRETVPIQVVLVVPKDYPAYVDFNLARDEVERWVQATQAWFIREVGLTFDYELTLHYSDKTIYELANGRLDGCSAAPIPEGQGLDWDHFWIYVSSELGGRLDTGGTGRQWAVVIGAGGWAGANYYGQGTLDLGRMILGDWGLHQLLGTADPCNPWGWDSEPGRAFGHEVLHTMNVPAHWDDFREPWLCGSYLGDSLCEEQKRDLVKNNRAFLRKP